MLLQSNDDSDGGGTTLKQKTPVFRHIDTQAGPWSVDQLPHLIFRCMSRRSSWALQTFLVALCLSAACSVEVLKARNAATPTPSWVGDGCEGNKDFLQAAVARNLEPWISALASQGRKLTAEFVRSRIDELMFPNDKTLKRAKGSDDMTPLDGLSEENQQIVPFLIHRGALYLYQPLRPTNRRALP